MDRGENKRYEYERVHLDRGDDITSILRKIKKGVGSPVELIIPQGMGALRNEGNLRLLKFYVDDTRRDVLLVTDDHKIATLARRVGLRVERGDAIERGSKIQNPITGGEGVIDVLPYRKEKLPSPVHPAIQRFGGTFHCQHQRRISFYPFFFILLAVGAVLYAFAPRVTIRIHPAIKEVSKTLTFTVSPDYKRVNVVDNLLPARALEFSFESTVTVPVTGKKAVGRTRATGIVTFINQSNDSIDIPAGTRLATGDGTFFRTNQAVTVPPATSRYLGGVLFRFEAGHISVAVEAEEKGTSGNVAAGKISRIADSKWLDLQVINETPTSGGTDQILAQVSIDDIKSARAELSQKVREGALRGITALLKKGEMLLEGTFDIRNGEISFNRELGELAPELTAATTAYVKALALDKVQLEEALGEAFLRGVDEGFHLIEDSLEVHSINANMLDGSRAQLQALVVGKVKMDVNTALLLKELRGEKGGRAREILTAMANVEKFEIVMGKKEETDDDRVLPRWPFWIKIVVVESTEGSDG